MVICLEVIPNILLSFDADKVSSLRAGLTVGLHSKNISRNNLLECLNFIQRLPRPWSLIPLSGLRMSPVLPCVQTGSRLAGKVPLGRTFPGNPIVWTLAGTSPGDPTDHVGFGDEIDLGLVIDIVVIKCAHAWNVLARWPNAKPVRTAKTTQPWLSPAGGGIRW